MSLTISLDYDKSLVDESNPPQWRHYAKEALTALHNAGHTLILHSCRCNPLTPTVVPQEEADAFYRWGTVPASAQDAWGYFDEMRNFLKAEGVWNYFSEVWQSPGKPSADIYVDDRMESPNWPRIAAELGMPVRIDQ